MSENIIDIENENEYDRIKEIEKKKKARLQQMRECSRNKRLSSNVTSRENDIRRDIYNNSPGKADQINARNRENYKNSPEKADQINARNRESYQNDPEKADEIKAQNRKSYQNSPEKADRIKARNRKSYRNSPEKADHKKREYGIIINDNENSMQKYPNTRSVHTSKKQEN